MYGNLEYKFFLDISSDELLNIYKGAYRKVRIVSTEGVVIELDCEHLKRFTAEDGIHGFFKLITSSSHSFIDLIKLR